MPVKAVPVEAAEEAGEPPKPAPEEPVAAETKKEEVPEKPAPKAKSRAKAKAKPLGAAAKAKAAESAERAAKAQMASDKAAEKAKKEQEKVDMKARVKCPVCHRTVSQHCLLYTHKCSQAALDKKPKPPTVEEKFEKKEVPEPEVEEATAPPPPPVAPKRRKVVRYTPEESDEEVPPPPPLVRQPTYAPPAYQPSYREQLILRQRERQHHQALAQVAPIRRLFRR